jgi:hypothetical protein
MCMMLLPLLTMSPGAPAYLYLDYVCFLQDKLALLQDTATAAAVRISKMPACRLTQG